MSLNFQPPKSLSPNPFDQAVYRLLGQLTRLPVVGLGQIQRLSEEVPALDPLDFLWWNAPTDASNPGYWRNRQGRFSLAALGVSHEISANHQDELPGIFEQLRQQVAGTQALYFGGCSYNGRHGDHEWQAFPAASFRLPLVEFRKTHDSYELAVNLKADHENLWYQQRAEARSCLEDLVFTHESTTDLVESKNATNPVLARQDSLTLREWRQWISFTLNAIRRGEFQKAVLARSVDLTLGKPLDIGAALGRWQNLNPNSFCFALGQGEKTFMGCSPERLFVRKHQQLKTESLAGTMRRGRTKEEDFFFEQILKQDPKLKREHQLVSDYLTQTLAPLTQDLHSIGSDTVFKLAKVQHRYLPFQAQLKPEAGDYQILSALHPTPAICGFPKKVAADFIEQMERTNRGWYSGLVGVVSEQFSEFAVAIRSALVTKQSVKCYSGVGIVEGSDADSEWQEMEDKICALLAVLSG